jgi:hypothetical protein
MIPWSFLTDTIAGFAYVNGTVTSVFLQECSRALS